MFTVNKMLNNKPKKHMKSRGILLVILVLIGLIGVYYENVNFSTYQGAECDLSASSCEFRLENEQISVKFLSDIVVEEEIFLEFDLSQGLKLEKAWIEGVNMFMGKTPVIKENEAYLTFLGSCNLDTMKWRLVFTVTNKKGQASTHSAIFFTYLD